MTYTLISGEFVIRYADIPRQGPQPDGDTVKFQPATPALVESLPRPSGTPPRINARGVSVRLEAVDALETHFEEAHQELTGANAARDTLLGHLGFTGVAFYPDLPNTVESADQDSLPGYILSNGVDANGRLIGFVYPGSPVLADGSTVFLDNPLVDESANALLLQTGLVYPAFYSTLPASLRIHLAEASRTARSSGIGIWARSTADPNSQATIASLAALEELVIWPKLFRRLVSYLAAGNTSFDGLDSWLRADPIHRDDTLFFLDPPEQGNMHDIITASGQHVQLNRWPEDFIISPDPAPGGSATGHRPFIAGDVTIVALLPDPVGSDSSNETVTLVNTTSDPVDLKSWSLADANHQRQPLEGIISPGDALRVSLSGPQLDNRGGSLTLRDDTDATIDLVSYRRSQVQRGRTIVFGR